MKMEDIAKIAGVSKAAVSLALNGKPGIGAETRDRILEIARDNNYVPKLRTASRTEQLSDKSLTFLVFANSGIVLEQYYQQPFFRELIHFIEERCRTEGYALLFSSIEIDSLEEEIKAAAEEGRSSGIILLGTNLTRGQIAYIADILSSPLVALDICYESLPVHFVGINNVMGAYQAGQHLYDQGHRHIGYIASNERIHNFDDRRRGFMAALKERGIDIPNNQIFSVAPTILSSQESLKHQLNSYMDTGAILPTAFFCECDYIAISAIKTLTELGIRVPEDISIVGFDNIKESIIVTPELTTIHVEKERMASLAVDLLIQSIADESLAKTKILVDTRFVERKSSGSPGLQTRQ